MTFTYDLADFIDFKDTAACERVRRIKREDIAKHPNPDFRIEVMSDAGQFYSAFATDIVMRIKQALDEGRRFVAIFPVGPMPQYPIAAAHDQRVRVPIHHVHTFNMDEYADQNGNTAPVDWAGSFQRAMFENFFDLIDPDLRPPLGQIHFPTREVIDHYGRRSPRRVERMSATAVSAGVGTSLSGSRHSVTSSAMTWKPTREPAARLVELTPMTIMQNALHSFGGDWSWVPPKANTIGPAADPGRETPVVSGWTASWAAASSWQRFIARLVAHGPVNTLVPGSILQTAPTRYIILGGVADDVEIHMA